MFYTYLVEIVNWKCIDCQNLIVNLNVFYLVEIVNFNSCYCEFKYFRKKKEKRGAC